MKNCCRYFLIINFAFCVLTISSLAFAVAGDSICSTPNNKTGICTHFDVCGELMAILTNPNITENEKIFLQKSKCDEDFTLPLGNKRIKICCPTTVNTTEIWSRTTKHEDTTLDECEFLDTTTGEPDISNRIFGGEVALLGEFPWTALIEYRKSQLYFGFHCGGSLISSRYVLTAAHCVKNPSMPTTWEVFAVRLGDWNIETEIDCEIDISGIQNCAPAYRHLLITESIIHQNYIPGSHEQYFDIALLRLAQSVAPFTNFIKPICLPIRADVRNSSYSAPKMIVAGWGSTTNSSSSARKLKAELPVWDTRVCKEKFLEYGVRINESIQFCAGGESGIDTCRGDSGGPIMAHEVINNRNVYFITGIISFGSQPCGVTGWPGVYTRVEYFIDWIKQQVEVKNELK